LDEVFLCPADLLRFEEDESIDLEEDVPLEGYFFIPERDEALLLIVDFFKDEEVLDLDRVGDTALDEELFKALLETLAPLFEEDRSREPLGENCDAEDLSLEGARIAFPEVSPFPTFLI